MLLLVLHLPCLPRTHQKPPRARLSCHTVKSKRDEEMSARTRKNARRSRWHLMRRPRRRGTLFSESPRGEALNTTTHIISSTDNTSQQPLTMRTHSITVDSKDRHDRSTLDGMYRTGRKVMIKVNGFNAKHGAVDDRRIIMVVSSSARQFAIDVSIRTVSYYAKCLTIDVSIMIVSLLWAVFRRFFVPSGVINWWNLTMAVAISFL